MNNHFKIYLIVALSFFTSFNLSANDTFFSIENKGDRVCELANTGGKSIDDLLVNGAVPSVRNKAFTNWFDNLTPDELDLLWSDSKIQGIIKDRIRHPGGLHEWCMVCETPKFKKWNVSMDEIKRFRTDIPDLTWKVPDDVPNIGGSLGGHGSTGSTTFHNELQTVISNSNSISEFNTGLNNLINRWDIDPNLLPPLISN